MSDLWNFVQDKPDSVLAILNSVEASTLRGEALADYQLLKAIALDKLYVDVASDSLARPAAVFFNHHGPKEKEMMALYYLGISQYYAGDYHSAIFSLDKARPLAEECGNLRYRGMIESAKSYVYCAVENYADAISSATSSMQFFSQLPDSSFLLSQARLQRADCYLYYKQFDKAYEQYHTVLSAMPDDTLIQKRDLPSMAWSLYMSEPNRKGDALFLFNQAIHQYHSTLNPAQLHHLGVILLESNRIESYKRILGVLKEFPNQTALVNDLEYRELRKNGDYSAALRVLETLYEQQESHILGSMSQSLVRRQRDYNEQEINRAEGIIRTEQKKNHLLFFILLSSFVMVVCVGYVFRKKTIETQIKLISSIEEVNQALQASIERNGILENELDLAREKYVLSFKKQFQKIGSLVEYYHSTSGRKDARDLVYRQVMDLSVTVGRDRQSMKALERSVNVALNNAMKLYREDYPNKSQVHYDLVCYFMAGFPASLIELLTGIPKNTVYSKKQRLLLKLESGKGDHCNELIRAIK